MIKVYQICSGHVRSGRSAQVISYQDMSAIKIMPGPVRSSRFWTFHVRSDQDRTGQVTSDNVRSRSVQGWTGEARPDQGHVKEMSRSGQII